MTVPASATNTTVLQRLSSLCTVVFGTILFLVVVGLTSSALQQLIHGRMAETVRSRATIAISGAALGEIIALLLLVAYLRMRGRTLANLGLAQSSPIRGWIVAAVFTALYMWMTLAAVLKGQPVTEISGFRIYNSLAAGLTAGFVEEIFFRGFVMNQLQWCGFGTTVQALASSLLFGIAHVGWGIFSGKPAWSALIGATVSTAVLGCFFAITYVVSRRSLLPAIAGHIVMDMLIEPWLVLAALGGAMGGR